MNTITLSKTETSILVAAASRPNGLIEIPAGTKPTSRKRLVGRFLKDGLAAAEQDGTHRLTPAGYRAIGLRPPRKPKQDRVETGRPAQEGGPAARPDTKLALIRGLLARPDGATLDELIAATGWLPHTTRAALSRIRSAGQPLAREARPDGKMAYRIEAAPAVPAVASDQDAPAAPTSHARRGRRKAGADEIRAAA